MKKVCAVLLLMSLFISGCGITRNTVPTATAAPVSDEPQKLLGKADVPFSMVEKETVAVYDAMSKGYMRYPYSAWKKIVETCFILNPTAGAKTGSKTIYDLPGYDYDISLDEVLRRGTSGGFCCAGFVSWLFYNILVDAGYGDYTGRLISFDESEWTYKAVNFYHTQNDHELREITLAEAEVGDLIVYGGQRNDHQHIVFYAGRDPAGNALVWHSGQDGVGRMRADRMQTNGVLNYIAHVYSYFEPYSGIRVVGEPGAKGRISGPLGFEKDFELDGSGIFEISELDLGNYTVSLLRPDGKVGLAAKLLLDESLKNDFAEVSFKS